MNKPRQQSDQKLQRRKRGFVRGICGLGLGFEGKGFPSHTRLEQHKEATAHVKVWIIAADPKAQVGIQSVGAVS